MTPISANIPRETRKMDRTRTSHRKEWTPTRPRFVLSAIAIRSSVRARAAADDVGPRLCWQRWAEEEDKRKPDKFSDKFGDKKRDKRDRSPDSDDDRPRKKGSAPPPKKSSSSSFKGSSSGKSGGSSSKPGLGGSGKHGSSGKKGLGRR
jgi:hypothetical protein